MKQRIKSIFKSGRVIVLLIFLILALASLAPNPMAKGVAIRSILPDSAANEAGISNPKPSASPMSREVISFINNRPILTIDDYYEITSDLRINQTLQVFTNEGRYKIVVKERIETIELNETELKEITIEVFNATLNETVNITRVEEIQKVLSKPTGEPEAIGLRIYQAPTTNIRKGLDLQGGTRVLLQPEEKIEKYDMDTLIENMKERLNVYGLSDIQIRQAGDLSGNQYILVEIAGATQEEVKDLLAKQGKFQAKVGDITVFKGGQDITYVCRSAECSGIDPNGGCNQVEGGHACKFRFSITMSMEAAQRQAAATKDLEIIREGKQQYLSEKLYLYLDDNLVDELFIGADLKGKSTTDISISGSGVGQTEQEAIFDALNNMKKLQTILITGSLPVKLNIVKTDAISPLLGEEFVKNAFLIGALALLSVLTVILIRYRKIAVALPIMVTMISELVIILGVASLIGWNLDLAAIAGIIIAIGTGVDHKIIIADETLRGESGVAFNWKEKIKRALFIIMAAYFTTVVAMIPLMSAGAGLLKGFAITTIMGVSIGVFVTRPAFAAMIEVLLKE